MITFKEKKEQLEKLRLEKLKLEKEQLEKEMAEADDLVEEATSTKPVLVTATTPDGRTMNYSCRVVNINKVNEE